MYKKFLITGGCGFLGTALIKRLTREVPDCQIRVLDNLKTGAASDLHRVCDFKVAKAESLPEGSGVFLIEGDIRDKDAAEKCSAGVECIVHLAANTGVQPSVENPRFDMECNVIGTFNMLDAARKHSVDRFVFASSGAPAGEVEPPIHEELPPHPVSPYGASKLAGEGYCSAYSRTFGVDTVCLRFGNVYGPGSGKKSSVVAKFIRQALLGEVCHIYGDGGQTRDFIFIEDLIEAMLCAVEIPEIGGEVFQIASGGERTVSEITAKLRSVLEDHGVEMLVKHEEARIGDVRRNYSDTSKALDKLGWKPKMDIDEGIRKTVSYFLKNRERLVS